MMIEIGGDDDSVAATSDGETPHTAPGYRRRASSIIAASFS
jgi:hypothetical protein